MKSIEELLLGESRIEDAERDVVDEEIDLDAEDWFGSIEEDTSSESRQPRAQRPAA